MRQGQADTEKVVQVGHKLFHELGERSRRTEAEAQVYREGLAELAVRLNIEVPAFLQGEGVGGFDQDHEDQARKWLSKVLSSLSGAEVVEKGEPQSTRGRGGSSRGRGRGDGRNVVSRTKRPRAGEEME